ncbi:uncharacterized protein LOC124282180 isoform X1 [Haliotis rubra]|uniref:uncharacterized protein LOC124282180 isoform X1 n=1 Tax=Haliotis rubra TaxID=36100 RepID=UPI001EE613E5|nr:uncharacterized protein LOC124282180 isoform X1 [Haliotis rubra]
MYASNNTNRKDKHRRCRLCNQRVKGQAFNQHVVDCACAQRRCFECRLCQTRFDTRNHLIRHIDACSNLQTNDREDGNQRTPSNVYLCESCGLVCDNGAGHECSHAREMLSAGKRSGITYTCPKCDKLFRTRTKFNAHIKKCCRRSLYSCESCGKIFQSQRSFHDHSSQCRNNNDLSTTSSSGATTKKVTCRQCHQRFESRKLLWRHQRRSHYGANGELLQPEPWPEGDARRPWTDQVDGASVVNETLKDVYITHRDIILRPHKYGGDNIVHTFNFPLTEPVNTDAIEFRNQLDYIFQHEENSFKVNLSFGMILRHIETGEYRYFIPYENTFVFDRPPLIHKRDSLNRVVKRIHRKNLDELIFQQRPNTKWKPVFITNVAYRVYRTNYVLGKKILSLPTWLKNKRCVMTVGDHEVDSLCAFRCLAYHQLYREAGGCRLKQTPKKSTILKLFRTFMRAKGRKEISPLSFKGLNVPDDVPLFERTFNVRVNIFKMQDEGHSCVPVYLSNKQGNDKSTLNMDCYENHLSYIVDLEAYAKRFKCRHCDMCFGRRTYARNHEKSGCCQKSVLRFPGGYFSPPQTIFDQLEERCGIYVPLDDRLYEYHAMFDGESLLIRESVDESQKTSSTSWTTRHHPVSISVCSNVPGYKEPKCIVTEETESLLAQVVDYVTEIATEAKRLTELKLQPALVELRKQIDHLRGRKNNSVAPKRGHDDDVDGPSPSTVNRLSKPNVYRDMLQGLRDDSTAVKINYNEWEDINEADVQARATSPRGVWTPGDEWTLEGLVSLLRKVTDYCNQLPLLGFNSSKYDLNLWKSKLARALNIIDDDNNFIIKRNNQYISIVSQRLKILDISNFMPPGVSYDQFLLTFNVSQSKGFFCYEYLDSFEKLEETKLPSIEAFWSNLKGINTLEDVNWQKYVDFLRTETAKNKSTQEILSHLKLKNRPQKRGGELCLHTKNME